ncbi:hypothetical protein [Anabaena lutea]|uniref:Transcriptional regulator n=1 Tax=Anabaena lutea FACHB-196 TaxID=2692881 RepID=A0ABR8FJJ2_9NOST|nr:hypothetical protein [Anabaena lutea]MBD2570030.1 hypothetical protein [Anabaena lutea FACHB-196]
MVELEDWKEVLLQEVSRSNQYHVAMKLGVSPAMISKVIQGNYNTQASKLPLLVKSRLKPQTMSHEESEWLERLKYICSIYRVRDVAKILDFSASYLYMVTADKIKTNSYNLKIEVMAKLYDDEILKNLKLRPKAVKKKSAIKVTEDLTVAVADAIYCNGIASYDDLIEKFPRHGLSRSLSILEKMGAINVIKPSLIGRGKGTLPRSKYGIACKCSAPGNTDRCAECPLGKMIISVCGLDDDGEEFD